MAVEPISLSVGIGVSVGALLLAFKGVVDSFVLIDAITEADNGSQYLALKYYIEKGKLDAWADHFNIYRPDESALRFENADTRTLIRAILVEISSLNDSAKKYLKRYAMHEPQTPSGQGLTGSDNITLNDQVYAALKTDRRSKKQQSKFRWATKDKTKFTELVGRLKELVADLHTLLRVDKNDSLDRALLVYVLASISDMSSLDALQQPDSGANALLSLSAHLKRLQISPSASGDTTASVIQLRDLDFGSRGDQKLIFQPRTRHLCYYSKPGQLDQRGWTEWKLVPSNLLMKERDLLKTRLTDLSVLLSAKKSDQFRIPPLLGTVTPQVGSSPGELYGFVYAYPSDQYDERALPISLQDLIKSQPMPLLNERFRLASALASSMSLLHASRWLHKGFRSSNILFFKPLKGDISITDPYVTGFEYSRLDKGPSIERALSGDLSIDLYFHPDTTLGFDRKREIYSLGVVLFEIALWRSFDVKVPKDMKIPLDKLTLDQVFNFLLKSVHVLGGVMGAVYRDVVQLCLSGDFGVQDDEDGADLARAFFQLVVRQLDACRV